MEQAKKQCPDCDGKGGVEVIVSPAHQAWSVAQGTYIVDDEFRMVPCERCDGTGELHDEDEHE